MGDESRVRIGKAGEELARRYLEERGYVVLAANFRFRRKEIDLVAEGGGFVVFVEVKLRSGMAFGSPESAVDPAKQASITLAARAFLAERGLTGRPCRFDVVAIRREPGSPPRITHIPDAFTARSGLPRRSPRLGGRR